MKSILFNGKVVSESDCKFLIYRDGFLFKSYKTYRAALRAFEKLVSSVDYYIELWVSYNGTSKLVRYGN